MHYLEIDHEWIEMNILQGDTQTEAFLAQNPNSKIPLLELPSGQCLSESNAILNYLAQGTRYLPEDVWERANVLKRNYG